MPAAQDVLRRFEHVEDSGLVVRERAAIRRATTPYGMPVDEYVPSDGSAVRELGEVYRLAYGMSPARNVEIQEAR